MSEPIDYQYEEGMAILYEELGPQWAQEHPEEWYNQHYEDAISAFTGERLQSYYSAHPDMAKNAYSMKEEAATLISTGSRASLLCLCQILSVNSERAPVDGFKIAVT